MGTSATQQSTVVTPDAAPDAPAVASNPLSSELSVRQQLKAMLEKMTPGYRAKWLRESTEVIEKVVFPCSGFFEH